VLPKPMLGLEVGSEELHCSLMGAYKSEGSVAVKSPPVTGCLPSASCATFMPRAFVAKRAGFETSSWTSIDPVASMDRPLLGEPHCFLSGTARPVPPLRHSGASFPGAGGGESAFPPRGCAWSAVASSTQWQLFVQPSR
jgi:hypothetical protein